MKKLIVFMLMSIASFSFLTVSLQADEKTKNLIGEWIYQVSDAPYGYEKGSIIFSEKDGKPSGIVKLEAGELQISELKIVKDSVLFVTYVDGSPINVKLKLTENKLAGTVDSPEGPKNLVAEKKQQPK